MPMNVDESMINPDGQSMLQRWVKTVSRGRDAVVVEVGCYRGGTTVRLAEAVQESGGGQVYAVDPHREFTGIYGGKFSQRDCVAFKENIERAGCSSTVRHLCMNSEEASRGWTDAIDLLFVDGDHSYQGVATDMHQWIRHVRPGGVVAFDDVVPGSEVESALIECMDWPRFKLVDRLGSLWVYQKLDQPRPLYLCAGMQSGGTTLISWCFLQREDMDGVYDMENARLHEDFSRVRADKVWLKMTVGAFRLQEVIRHYARLGWDVRPLLVVRNPYQVYGSLKHKSYGFNGATGDEPPLEMRMARYLADWQWALENDCPCIAFESFVDAPEAQLRALLRKLALPWDSAMLEWPKTEGSVACPSLGNVSFRTCREQGGGLIDAIERYRKGSERTRLSKREGSWIAENMLPLLDHYNFSDEVVEIEPAAVESCPHPRYRGTQRDLLLKRVADMEVQLGGAPTHLRWYEAQAGRPRLAGLLLQLPFPRRMLRFWRYWLASRSGKHGSGG